MSWVGASSNLSIIMNRNANLKMGVGRRYLKQFWLKTEGDEAEIAMAEEAVFFLGFRVTPGMGEWGPDGVPGI